MCACKYLIGHRSTLPDDKALFCEKKYWASFNFFAGALSLCTLCCINVVASFKWMRGLCFFTQGWSPSEWVYFKPSACWIVWQQLKPFFWQWTLGLASANFCNFPWQSDTVIGPVCRGAKLEYCTSVTFHVDNTLQHHECFWGETVCVESYKDAKFLKRGQRGSGTQPFVFGQSKQL